MNKLYVLILISYFTCSCNASDNIKKLKAKDIYTFEVDNTDIKTIGYKHFEEDMDIGVNSIFVFDDVVYFSDPYHNNIKAFDLSNKELKASIELVPWITDLAVYNHRIYVVSEYSSLIILNINLDQIEAQVPMNKGNKYFIKHDDGICIINTSVFERTGDTIIYEGYKLNSTLGVDEIKIKSNNAPNRLNFNYKESQNDGRIVLKVNGCNYEIPHTLKEISQYEAYNIYIEENRIVYFYSDNNLMSLEIFKY